MRPDPRGFDWRSLILPCAVALCRIVPIRTLLLQEAALTWLRLMAGIKQSGSRRKKGGSSNFIALLPVSFGNKAIKLSGARHLFCF
jgi:hypothetical protein